MHRRICRLSNIILILATLTIVPSANNMLAAKGGQAESTPGLTVPQEVSPVPRQTAYPHLPVYFESNVGQFDSRVRFASRTHGVNVFLTDSDAVLVVKSGTPGKQQLARSVTIAAVNGNTAAGMTGLDKLPGKVNYFYGDNPKHWHTDVPIYQRVKYTGVYPGIDLLFRGNGQQLEFDFVLAPGAEPARIALAIKGSDTIKIDQSGDAILGLGKDTLRLHKPRIYQQDGMRTRDIPGAFRQDSRGNLRFQVAAYDRSLPLVIDPVVSYSSYLGGGSSGDQNMGTAIAVHSGGSAYVTGFTTTADFPVTAGVFQPEDGTLPSSTSNFDGFVARISNNGKQLVYASYLAGEGQDIPMSIAVDATGNAYVTGKTQSDDFPVTNDAYQVNDCGSCAFLTKITPNGSSIVYSTYLGRTLTEARGIAVDAGGSAYLMGNTSSSSFPTTEGVVQPD
ncbi:MAG: SBBP repeat-containing protein, partial [Thiogranum sp.]